MGEGIQFLDIIIFAMIAVFLVMRLRSVLGRRTGHERRRDPFAAGRAGEKGDKIIPLPDRGRPAHGDEVVDIARDPMPASRGANPSGAPAEPGGLDRAATLARLKSPRCESVLRRLPARRGDVFLIPAGTVHAITEGLLLYEVQQNSDTTFRLYDWGRVDAQGNPRTLHVAQAGEVADVTAREGYRIRPLRVERGTHAEDYLVACPYFALVKWSGFCDAAGAVRLSAGGRFRVVTALAGEVALRDASGAEIRLGLGDTVLVPASHDGVEVVPGAGGAELLVSFVPDLEQDIRAPLRAAGHSEAAIRALGGPEREAAGDGR